MSSELKIQTYVAKCKGNDPWFNNDWLDIDKVTSIDESVSDQATVTCEGVTTMCSTFDRCINPSLMDFYLPLIHLM